MKNSEKDIIIEACNSLFDSAFIAQNSLIEFPDSNQNENLQNLIKATICCERKLHELLKH